MNEHQQPEEQEEEFPPVNFTEEMQYYLYETAKWARLIAVFGFLFGLFMLLFAFTVGSVFQTLVKSNPSLGSMPGGAQAIGIFYLVLSILCFVPSVFLYQFAGNAKEGINYSTEAQILAAFAKLKSYFKFCGIVILVIVSLYVLTIVLTLIGKAGLGA